MSVLPFGRAQRGRGSTQARWPWVSQRLPEARLCLQPEEAPAPPSPLLGQGLSTGSLEAALPEAEPEPVVFKLVLLPSLQPPSSLPLSCLSFLAICSWIVSEMGFLGAAGAAPSQYCSPSALSGPSASPLPWLHQVFPGLRKPAQHFPPLCNLCVEFCC